MEISLHTYGDHTSPNANFLMQNTNDIQIPRDINVKSPPLTHSSSPRLSLPIHDSQRLSNHNTSEYSSNPSVQLLDTELWNSFNRVVNEMIVTRDGRRLFPVFKVRVIGLDPNQIYKFELDFQLVDSYRWKYVNCEWLRSTRCDVLSNSRVYTHPDSPNHGHFWMDSSVSFSRIKITNRESSSLSKVFLHSMYKYIPRLIIKKVDEIGNETLVGKFSFTETEFIAVTAYQNEQVTKLKVAHNPFAKAFQEPRRAERFDRQDSLSRQSLSHKTELSSDGMVCCGISRVRLDTDRYSLPSMPYYNHNSMDPYRRTTDLSSFEQNGYCFGPPNYRNNIQNFFPTNGYLNTTYQQLSPNGLFSTVQPIGNIVSDHPFPRYAGTHSLPIDSSTLFHDTSTYSDDSRLSSLSLLAAVASQQPPPNVDDRQPTNFQPET